MSGSDGVFVFQSGDVLLFSRRSLFNFLITLKTWSPYTHVEVADVDDSGDVTTFASRNKEGVGEYVPDLSGLALVLRLPDGAFNRADARWWFLDNEIWKQGYDYIGLFNFFYARFVGPENGRMFCSEFVTRFLRAGGWDPFPDMDADTIAPRDFRLMREATVVWDRRDAVPIGTDTQAGESKARA
jgi:hypothetical protein